MSPMKPTREDAARASRPEEMEEQALSPRERAEARPAAGEKREPRGDRAGSQRHPPHVTENFEEAPAQAERQSPSEVEELPATASGQEKVSADEAAQGIDPESAYDRRPGEDKDRPPSTRID